MERGLLWSVLVLFDMRLCERKRKSVGVACMRQESTLDFCFCFYRASERIVSSLPGSCGLIAPWEIRSLYTQKC